MRTLRLRVLNSRYHVSSNTKCKKVKNQWLFYCESAVMQKGYIYRKCAYIANTLQQSNLIIHHTKYFSTQSKIGYYSQILPPTQVVKLGSVHTEFLTIALALASITNNGYRYEFSVNGTLQIML